MAVGGLWAELHWWGVVVMALSCSTQLLQRSWLVYFRQGTLCLASSAANVGLRSRAFTASSFILRSHSRVSQTSFPAWRPRDGSSVFGFQSVRALSSSSVESVQGSGQALAEASPSVLEEDESAEDLKDVQEDIKLAAAASVAEGEGEDGVEKHLDSSAVAPEDQYDMAVNASLQQDVEEALATIDLNDGGRPASVMVDGEAEESESENFQDQHPWPEWDKYLKMLEAGGHFIFDNDTIDRRPVVRQEDDSGKIKRASMAFARSRDDIIKYESIIATFLYCKAYMEVGNSIEKRDFMYFKYNYASRVWEIMLVVAVLAYEGRRG